MPVQSLTICGYRGFATAQTIRFAVPNGEPGSGLTVIVGPNNGGKSTVLEALGFFASTKPPSFSDGKRNKVAGDRVEISLEISGPGGTQEYLLTTVPGRGSQSRFSPDLSGHRPETEILVLPSRRQFPPFFGQSYCNRVSYAATLGSEPDRRQRSGRLEFFGGRLFSHMQNETQLKTLNGLVSRVYGSPVKWTVDQSDQGSYFVKFEMNGGFHNSEGAGDGLTSILFILDALSDSKEGALIAVDEPELSLHPALQRRLAELFMENAADKQIVLSTHSPYFIPLEAVARGATVARVRVTDNGCAISQLNPARAAGISGLLEDLNNPHVLGLDAREIFFISDNVILVEGQEDVVSYKKLAEQLAVELPGSFFGWGVGGAKKMELVAGMLQDLGFEKVVGILDRDERNTASALRELFPKYKFLVSPAPNVRDKPSVNKEAVEGLLDKNGFLRPEYKEKAKELLQEIARYLAPQETGPGDNALTGQTAGVPPQ